MKRVDIKLYTGTSEITIPNVDESTARNIAEDFQAGRVFTYGGLDGVTYFIRTAHLAAMRLEEFMP
jgi:hypothetical protein